MVCEDDQLLLLLYLWTLGQDSHAKRERLRGKIANCCKMWLARAITIIWDRKTGKEDCERPQRVTNRSFLNGHRMHHRRRALITLRTTVCGRSCKPIRPVGANRSIGRSPIFGNCALYVLFTQFAHAPRGPCLCLWVGYPGVRRSRCSFPGCTVLKLLAARAPRLSLEINHLNYTRECDWLSLPKNHRASEGVHVIVPQKTTWQSYDVTDLDRAPRPHQQSIKLSRL